jgi:iron complex outermembrane recepter protein
MNRPAANTGKPALTGLAALALTLTTVAAAPALAADPSPATAPNSATAAGQAAPAPQTAPPEPAPDAPPPPGPPPPETGKLQTVTVTAERYRSDVQTTPISIAVLSGQDLQSESRTDLGAAIENVPSLHAQASPQGAQIYIRGVGTNGDSNWVDPDVALMFDGVYSGRAEESFSSLYDVNRIEVLRGPQGTIYGRNAVGGVINILTNDPVIGRYEAGANVGGGNYRLMHADGYVNIPLSDKFAIRVAAQRETHTGYYSNGGGAEHINSARVKALWLPTSDWSVLASLNYWHSQGLGPTTVSMSDAPWAAAPFASYGTYEANNPWHVGPLVLGPPPPPYGPGGALVAYLTPDDDDYEFLTYSVKSDWNLGWATLTLLPSYSYSNRFVMTNLFAPGPRTPNTWHEKQYTGEARLQSPADEVLKWVAGLYVLSTDETTSGSPGGGTTFIVTPTSDHPASSVAGFAQVTYPFTSRARIVAGLRYTHDDKSLHYSVCTSDNGATCNGVYDSGETTLHDTYGAVTWKAGLEYDLAPESMLYAQVATGYKAGGYAITEPPIAYKPERLTAFETGIKNRFLDDRLQVNAEVYYYRYNNYQVSYAGYTPYTFTVPAQYVPADAGEEFQGFVSNASTGRNVGGELEMKYRFTRHDQLDVSLAYIDARYGQLTVPTTGGPPGTTNDSGSFDFEGQPVANTPRQSANLGYEHDWTVDGGLLALRLSSKLSSGYYAQVSEWFGGAWQPAYTRSSAFLDYTTASGAWSIDLWGNNLENGAQKAYVYPFFRAELADPRTFGATLSYRFD